MEQNGIFFGHYGGSLSAAMIDMHGVFPGQEGRVKKNGVGGPVFAVFIGQGAEIGYDLERDRRNFHVSPGGIVVIPKNAVVDGATNTIVAHATGAELSEA